MIALPLALLIASADAPKLLVLNLDDLSGNVELARSIDPIVLAAASRSDITVVSQGELTKIADIEASRAQLNCDTSSCLAELAGAMGARFVLFGSVSQLGATVTVSLSLFDNASALVQRDTLAVTDPGELPRALPPRVKKLVAKGMPQLAPTAAAVRNVEPGVSPLTIVGVVGLVSGAAGAVGSGAFVMISESHIQDPAANGAAKQDSQAIGVVALAALALSVAIAGAGGALLVLQ